LQGDSASVTNLPNNYLGPVLRVRNGQHVRVRFTNELPEPSIVHWHGMLVPAEMDGHPSTAIQPGETFIYEFQVMNRAGTYWFHPHPHGLTGGQVYRGLAGLLIVGDEDEDAARLPQSDADLSLIIQDRVFDDENQLVYIAEDDHAMMGAA
jgi:FtsP/CotA-like multicopper oxidase with cupredoxin domain